MEKVRVYTICYRKNARRHFDCFKNTIESALKYINDVDLIDRYRVQIVTGDNNILLFDSASIIKDPSVFHIMVKEGYGATYQRLLNSNWELMTSIILMCKDNRTRVKHYNTRGYLSTDKYC